MERTISLPCFGIVVTLDGEKDPERPDLPRAGGGTIASDLHEASDPDYEGGSEEDAEHDKYEAAMDAIESIILAHACAGIDIQAPAYIEGIETAVGACGHASGG